MAMLGVIVVGRAERRKRGKAGGRGVESLETVMHQREISTLSSFGNLFLCQLACMVGRVAERRCTLRDLNSLTRCTSTQLRAL